MKSLTILIIIGIVTVISTGHAEICKKAELDGWCHHAGQSANCNIRTTKVCGGSFEDQRGDADTFEAVLIKPQYRCVDSDSKEDTCSTYTVSNDCYRYTKYLCDMVPISRCWRVITQEGEVAWYTISHEGGQEEQYYEIDMRRIQSSTEWRGDVTYVRQ